MVGDHSHTLASQPKSTAPSTRNASDGQKWLDAPGRYEKEPVCGVVGAHREIVINRTHEFALIDYFYVSATYKTSSTTLVGTVRK
jgi:hypothetical protein